MPDLKKREMAGEEISTDQETSIYKYAKKKPLRPFGRAVFSLRGFGDLWGVSADDFEIGEERSGVLAVKGIGLIDTSFVAIV